MSQDKKTSTKTTLLRLAFIITTITPMIFNFLARQSHRLLWKKVDADYINCLRIILSSIVTEESEKTNNSELLSHIHMSFYEKSSKVISISDKEVANFISEQKIFQGENSKFSPVLYKGFLIKNNITESSLLRVMREIYCNKLYKSSISKSLKIIGAVVRNNMEKIVKSKQISYDYYFLKEHMLKKKDPTEEELKKIYEEEKINNNLLLFSKSQSEGYLIKMKLSLEEKNKIIVDPKEIEKEFQDNSKSYQYKKISIASINFTNEDQANAVAKLYQGKEKNIKDLEENYMVNKQSMESDRHGKYVEQLAMIYQRVGIGYPLVFPMGDGAFTLIYITDYESRSKTLDEVNEEIKNKLQKKKSIEKKIQEIYDIKEQIEKDNGLISDSNYLKDKNIQINHTVINENQQELYDLVHGNKTHIIKENHLIIFIPLKKTSKYLQSWEEIEKDILKSIFLKKTSKELKKAQINRMIPYLLEGANSGSDNQHSIRDIWEHGNGTNNILTLLHRGDLKIPNIIFSCKRNDVTGKHQYNIIVKTKVLYNTMEFSNNTNQMVQELLNLLLKEIQEEYIISLAAKIAYFKSISKHQNFILKYFIS